MPVATEYSFSPDASSNVFDWRGLVRAFLFFWYFSAICQGILLAINATGFVPFRQGFTLSLLWLIPLLLFHSGKINASFIHPGRGTCLKPEHLNPIGLKGIRQVVSCLQPVRSCRVADITVDTPCLQISTCAEYDAFPLIQCS